jgi:hypothetical protein
MTHITKATAPGRARCPDRSRSRNFTVKASSFIASHRDVATKRGRGAAKQRSVEMSALAPDLIDILLQFSEE